MCRARSLSFCIRTKVLPDDVRTLFGGLLPSLGHGTRVCKILKAEWLRQARILRQYLAMQLQSRADPSTARRQLREYLTLADQTTEFIWQLQLRQLRERLPKKDPAQSTALHMPEELHLPEDVQQVLRLGPKFAVEPKKSPPELLSLVREVSRRVPEEDSARCVSEDVDVVRSCKPAATKHKVKRSEKWRRRVPGSACVAISDELDPCAARLGVPRFAGGAL
ncbi:hypothetical protein HPB47_005707 [Ixodes persulcatus]|uniref:Uncharacterized protein n=1 Tax=Ixodes persulcatus TaxID=34615 RepID=A0AC60PD50_IXOPE|nr:hypothetical protein HPB47_005707 [Ixodes persulcatus]